MRYVEASPNVCQFASIRIPIRQQFIIITMAVEQITINFGRPISLFPLSRVVVLPHGVTPLHIFESRYRRMTHDALDSDGLIAMAVFDDPRIGDEPGGGASPELRSHVCIGYIERYETLEDGRLMILLRGVCRACIVEEEDHEPYRIAMMEPTEWPPMADEQLVDERAALTGRIDDAALDAITGIDELRQLFSRDMSTVALIDLTLGLVCADAEARYRMLKQTDAHQRAAWLIGELDRRCGRT